MGVVRLRTFTPSGGPWSQDEPFCSTYFGNEPAIHEGVFHRRPSEAGGVEGRIQVHADGRTFDLYRGALLALDRGVPHDVEAVEDSAFLLTIAWPG